MLPSNQGVDAGSFVAASYVIVLVSAVLESLQISELQVIDAFVLLKHWSVTSAQSHYGHIGQIENVSSHGVAKQQSSTELSEVAVTY